MDRIFSFVNEERALLFARFSLALMLIWFGAMNFTAVGEGTVAGWFSRTMLISGMADMKVPWAGIIGGFQLVAGLGLAFGRGKIAWISAMMAMAFSALALLLMFFANVWIEGEGGFPVIGAGQGIIKYLSILGVGMFLAAHFHPDNKSAHCNKMRGVSFLITLFGIILVLGWIGAMKFTAIEADGIEPLLRTSPFFSWLLVVFDRQSASILIGIFEIFTAGLLLGWFFNRKVFLAGAALCVVTFLGTLSFMITFLPTWSADLGGFPALGGTGHFLLKDMVMLAGILLLVARRKA
ncbi:MAG: DUF417 family protein [Sphingomonadales bacterium]